MVELAWLWTRYQPAAAQVCWFRERVAVRERAQVRLIEHYRSGLEYIRLKAAPPRWVH
jgi:hypothetical protein